MYTYIYYITFRHVLLNSSVPNNRKKGTNTEETFFCFFFFFFNSVIQRVSIHCFLWYCTKVTQTQSHILY